MVDNMQCSESQTVAEISLLPDLKTLRAQIPSHCFTASLTKSLSYVARDLTIIVILLIVAYWIPEIDSLMVRSLCWIAYGFFQGLFFTGLWILAHECGHDSFSEYGNINAAIGFALHSIVLVPFFSWKYTHSRHHSFANHMERDTVFVPSRKTECWYPQWAGSFLSHTEDTSIVTLLCFTGHQILGWPLYIAINASAGAKSTFSGNRSTTIRQSHLDPGAAIFRPSERFMVLVSDLGLGIVLTGLWYMTTIIGCFNMFLLYGVPYLRMNHWLSTHPGRTPRPLYPVANKLS